MSDNVETLGIRLNAEGVPELTNGMQLAGAATENLGKKADAAGKALAGNTEQVNRSGISAKQTAAAWRLLPAQLSDVATQLASGTPVWMVAMQQGPQIKDAFGGVGPMFKELAGSLTLARISAGGLAVGAGAVVAAYAQASRETHAFNQALILTNNAAGTNTRQLAEMAAQVSHVVGTQGKASEALAALTATGEVGRANLQGFARTAVDMERELDTALTDTAAKFEALGRAPLEASLRLNQGLNYLTGATYDHVRALQAEGRWAEAAAVAQQAYATAMDQRTAKLRENLTIVEILWRKAGDSAKGAWDAFVDNLRPSTIDRKMEEVKDSLDVMQKFWNLVQGGAGAQAAWAGMTPTTPKDTSAEEAAEVARRKQELRERERANVEASIVIELAQAGSAAAQRQAVAEMDLARARAIGTARESQLRALNATLEDQRARDVVGLADYYERRAALDRQGLSAEIATVDAEIQAERRRADARARLLEGQMAAERRRQADNPAEQAQQQARLLELSGQRQALGVETESRLVELQAQRAKLTAQQIEAAVAGERAVMSASADATERWLDDVERRRQALAQLNDQQRQANAAAAVDLIADPYARAAARARLDIEELNRFYAEQLGALRARLPGLETSDPDQAAAVREQILQAKQQKNDAIVLRQKQLTEELKPEWKKQLEAWQDHTRLMRDSFDEFQNGWLDAGRNAWQDYLRTGRLSLNTLGQYMRQQFGDMIFKQAIAPAFSEVGQGIAGLFGMGSGAGDVTKATGLAAETTARSLNTTAVTANSTAMGNLAITANYAASALASLAASSGGSATAGLLGQIFGAMAGGGSAFSTVDAGGYGMTSGGASLPTAGGLAVGGSARRGSLYEVNEQGPELLSVNNRTYLMMGGQDGYVIPNGKGGRSGAADARGGVQITYAPQISIDSRSDRADIEQMVGRAVRSGQVELLDMMQRRQA